MTRCEPPSSRRQAGADALHVSAYADPTSGAAFTEAPLVHQECGYVDFAARIKQRVGIPVIAVGRIEPEQADRIIGEGRADFVAMGRKLLADPELPRKLAEGRPEDVRPCVYCYTCVAQIFVDRSLYCAVFAADTSYDRNVERLAGYAATHAMAVVMANSGADCSTYRSPGGSAIWSEAGDRVAHLAGSGPGLAVAHWDDDPEGEGWSGEAIRLGH